MSDPFPREPVSRLVHRLPAYGRLAWRLGRDPLLSRARRGAVLAAAGYVISPIDLVPGIIPVLGQLDDALVALAALRFALGGLSPERRKVHLASVGLTDQDLADDLRALGATTTWLVRTGGRAAARVSRVGLRMGADIAGRATVIGARGAGPLGHAIGDHRPRRGRAGRGPRSEHDDQLAGA